MSLKKLSILFLVLFAMPLAVAAQEGASQEGAAPAAQDTALPVPFGATSLAFTPELARTNYLDGGLRLGTTFDDNALNTSSDRLYDVGYSILPDIALRQSRGRLNWMLNYAAGFTVNQRLSARNQGSHDLGFESQYRLSPHVTLTLRDHFAMTTGFFDQVNQNFDSSSGSVLQRPNQFVVTPLARQDSNVATAQMSYQFSASSEVGGSGTFYRSHYKDAPVGTELIDTDTQEAEGFYNHRTSARNLIGATYRFQRLTFSPMENDTFVHSVLATYTFQIKPNVTLSLFAGPQHTDVSTQIMVPTVQLPLVYFVSIPIEQNSWSTAAGGSFSWNGQRTSFIADASRSVSDGGGLLGAVNLTSFDASVRRQVSRNYAANLGVAYGSNQAVSTTASPFSSLKSTTANFAIDRTFRNRLGLTLGYAHAFQTQQNAAPGSDQINHNRVWMSLSYNFSRPLGR